MQVRRIVFHDTVLDKDYVFTTNRFDWSASLAAQIYKQCWQVELFFHARIICFSRYILRGCQALVKMDEAEPETEVFFRLSDNAVMTQVMVAMCAYLLLAYLKFNAKFTQSLQQMIRLIRVNLFIRRSLTELFRPPDKTSAISPQLGSFYA